MLDDKDIKRRKISGVVVFRRGGGGTGLRVAECREEVGEASWRSSQKCGKDYEKAEVRNLAEAAHYPASQSFNFKKLTGKAT